MLLFSCRRMLILSLATMGEHQFGADQVEKASYPYRLTYDNELTMNRT